MQWDEAAKLLSTGTAGKFLRLGPGEAVRGVPGTSDVYVRETVWTGQGTEDYDPKNPEHKGLRPSNKFAINWYDYEAKAMQIWEMSQSTFKSLRAEVLQHGKGNVFRIKRIGEGKSTVYDCEALQPLTGDELQKVVDAFKRDSYRLKEELNPSAALRGGGATQYNDDDIPF